MAIPIIGDLLGGLLGGVKDVVSEVVVDKDKRNEIEANLERLKIETEDKIEQRFHDAQIAQIEVNKEEAKSEKLFVAGWRPAVGWICALGLAWATVLQPLLSWVSTVSFGYNGNFPDIDSTLLIFVLGGILGIGGMRSFEKVKGVSSDTIADNAASKRNQPVDILPPAFNQPPEEAPWAKGEGIY